jgi:hypothetical protein
MWCAFKGRCPICLSWRALNKGLMPRHVLSGKHCSVSGELPLERSVFLAEKQLIDLQEQLPLLRGTDLNYATKRIKNLQKILQNYKDNPMRIGKWQLRASFETESPYFIEKTVHKALAEYLDKSAPFGEVFLYSVEEAITVIEQAISGRFD